MDKISTHDRTYTPTDPVPPPVTASLAGGPAAGSRAREVHGLLRHRGGFPALRPDPGLFDALGGEAGIHRLVDQLYERIAADALLRHLFHHPEAMRDGPKRFFVEWFGGARTFADSLEPGLARGHQHLFVSPAGVAAWLRCMRDAVEASGQPPAPVMRLLGPMAKALVNSPDVAPSELRQLCGLAQDAAAGRLERALDDAARGRTDAVAGALAADPRLAQGRGRHGQSLLWVAVYKNRPECLRLLLDAGADPNLPACDPPRGEIVSNNVRLGTLVSVTPLAVARKRYPKLVPLLVEHGAVPDVFTAAWLGDRTGVAEFVERYPELVNATDPAEDFQEVTPLAHAVAGGDPSVVRLLLDREAEVRAHSGKLLRLAILLNRPDLVGLLLAHGADARRADSLGPLDPAERPIAELLIAHGARVPSALLPRTCRADVSRNERHRVGVLLAYGADVNGRGREGLTALHYAVRSGMLPVIRLLLQHGADVTARAPDGATPLLELAKTRATVDHVGVLELLAEYGADLDARTPSGERLLDFFARRGAPEAERWLLAHGADPGVMSDRSARVTARAGRHPAGSKGQSG